MKKKKKLLSKPILRQSIKGNWKLWAILTGVLCLFITLITVMSTLDIGGGSDGVGPPTGMNLPLIELYGQMFFGMMGVMLMMIYAIVVGNKLVASEVDRGTMSFTLNTQTTRKQIILTKAIYYVISIIAMAVLMGLFGTIASLAVGATLPLGTFWLMIFGFILFGLAISGICFAASCWFNKTGHSLMIGAGIPVAFWLLNSLSSIPNLEFMQYLSLNTLFDTSAIISGSGFIIQFVVLGVISVALYAVGIHKFLKKDLPL